MAPPAHADQVAFAFSVVADVIHVQSKVRPVLHMIHMVYHVSFSVSSFGFA